MASCYLLICTGALNRIENKLTKNKFSIVPFKKKNIMCNNNTILSRSCAPVSKSKVTMGYKHT